MHGCDPDEVSVIGELLAAAKAWAAAEREVAAAFERRTEIGRAHV